MPTDIKLQAREFLILTDIKTHTRDLVIFYGHKHCARDLVILSFRLFFFFFQPSAHRLIVITLVAKEKTISNITLFTKLWK